MSEIRGTIFLSHSSGDKPFVERVLKGLDQATVFYDVRTIAPGTPTLEAMKEGVSETAVFVLFHSIHNASAWVNYEKNLAEVHKVVNKNTRILVCPISGSDYKSLPDWMKGYMTTTEKYRPNDISRVIRYLYLEALHEAYPERLLEFPGREKLQRDISLAIMTASAVSGKVLSAVVLTGIQGMGRSTLASQLVSETYRGMKPGGPVFDIPPSGDAVDWHLQFYLDLNEGLSETDTAAQIVAFNELSPVQQARTIVSSLQHWGELNQVITIKHRWGLRDKGNLLRPWLRELLVLLQSEPSIRLILISERQLPIDEIKHLSNVKQFHLEELDESTVQFILSSRIPARFLDTQRLPALAKKISGHPATANYVALLVGGGRSMESLVLSSGQISAFQDSVLKDLYKENILSANQSRVLRLLSWFPRLNASVIHQAFPDVDVDTLTSDIWELAEFSLIDQVELGKYKCPSVVSSTYRRIVKEGDAEIFERVARILIEQFESGNIEYELIDSLLVSITSFGAEVPARLREMLTPAQFLPAIEKEYFDGQRVVGAQAKEHFERCASLARLAMGMKIADDALENILFYGADCSVRLGILPEDMLKIMQTKGFLTEDYIRASYLFHSNRDFDEAARILARSLSASRFRIRNVRLLARIYLRSGKHLPALETLNIVPEARLMRDSGLVVMKIKALRGTRNHGQANELRKKLKALDDEYGDIAVYYASAEIRAGNYSDALKHVMTAKKAPRANQAILSILQCACEVESGNTENLAVTCSLARSLGRDFDALQLQARAALASGDWRSAEEYITNIKRKDWFDLNVEHRIIKAKLADRDIMRDPAKVGSTKKREEELLRELVDAIEGSSFV